MSASPAETYLLPLTPFERYMLLDDRPHLPMTFLFQIELEGELDLNTLRAALQDAIGRHPLLTARLQGTSWQIHRHRESMPVLQVQLRNWGDPLFQKNAQEFIDLTREPGVRIWLEQGDARFRLTTQFHHACCDGIGALRFLGDWLAAYHAKVEGEPIHWPNVDPNLLQQRGRHRWKSTGEKVSLFTAIKAQIKEAITWIRRRPIPLAPSPHPGEASTPDFPGLVYHSFSRDETQQLRRAATNHNATLNDLLMAELFQSIAHWNQTHRLATTDEDWLQITIPTSLRDKTDDELSAANVIGYAFIARRLGLCVSAPQELLRSIAQEMEAVRKWNLGMYFIAGVEMFSKVPGLLKRFTQGQRCLATTIFTNLGDATRRFGVKLPREAGRPRAGKLTVTRVLAVPPLRPATRAVFAALTCGSELTLVIRSDRSQIQEQDAAQLFQQWLRRLQAFIAARQPHPTES